MTFDQALDCAVARGDNCQFRATVYAMNTLLLGKGVYSPEEFERLFIEHVQNEIRIK